MATSSPRPSRCCRPSPSASSRPCRADRRPAPGGAPPAWKWRRRGGLRGHRAMGSISVLLVRPVAAAVAAAGPGARDALRAAAGLTPELLADPAARIAVPQLAAAWAEALRL